MAVYYVRSTTGNDSNTGISWAYAKQTIENALTTANQGDTIYVSQAHNYYTSSGIAIPSGRGKPNMPISVICVNDLTPTPTQLATTAIVNNVSNSNDLVFQSGSYIYWYGINFQSMRHIYFPYNCFQIFDNCSFRLSNSTIGLWHMDPGSTNYGTYNLQFIRSTFSSAYVGSSFYFYSSHTGTASPISYVMLFRECILAGVALSNFMTWNSPFLHIQAIFEECDLSLLGASSNLLGNFTINTPNTSKIYVRNCKLNADLKLFPTAQMNISSPDVFIENSDASGTNTRNEWYRYQGYTKIDTTNIKTEGATNGVTPFSWYMKSNNNTVSIFPLESPPLMAWCGTLGSQVTATVSILHEPSAYNSYMTFTGTGSYFDLQALSDWTFGTGDYTLDCWSLLTDISTPSGIFDVGGSSSGGFNVLYFNGVGIRIIWGANTYDFSWIPIVGTWYHIAVVRTSNVLTVYINGVAIGTADVTSKTVTSSALRVGSTITGTVYQFKGMMSCVRVTKGTALWLTNFQIPLVSQAYTFDADTKLFVRPTTSTLSDEATSKTIIVTGNCIAKINQVLLQNSDLWAELEYQGTSSAPISSFVNTRPAAYPITSSPTNLSIQSDVVWTTSGFTAPNYQKIQLQFTPQMQGPVTIKIYLARSNYTVYIDPMINFS